MMKQAIIKRRADLNKVKRGSTFDGYDRIVDDLDHGLDGLGLRDVTATNLGRGFAKIWRGSGWFWGCSAKAAALSSTSTIPVGFAFETGSHNWELTRCYASGFGQTPRAGYVNGDGFTVALNCPGFRFIQCDAWDNSDGGFDLKSAAFLDRCGSGRNNKNYRFWTHIEATTLWSHHPRECHLNLCPGKDQEGQVVRVKKLIAVGGGDLIRQQTGRTRLIIGSLDLSGFTGNPTPVVQDGGSLTLEIGPKGKSA